ncbi:MAG: Mut7-C RNAse domain-containing protein [Candidatus Cloacimonadota bacterium]|nr:Mut7-C RNAse domain-containing protein [Candidatus Cloacimonadota bacterium]
MKKVYLRFYEELNDFLPPQNRKIQFTHPIKTRQSVKDLIESFGVPHTQVDLIIVNRNSVNFSYIVKNDDEISVYPVFETFDIKNATHLQQSPLRKTKFILDGNLHKLVHYMRMLGFDTEFANQVSEEQLIKRAKIEHRIIISRNRKLMKRRELTHGYCLATTDWIKQLGKILSRFHLYEDLKPFSRCFLCNTKLQTIDKEKILNRLPKKVIEQQNEFTICEKCNKIYWKGSHYKKMLKFIEKLKNSEEK